MKEIVVAGGCFWGVEEYFYRLKGIIATSVGYANGNYLNPTYEEVCQGKATHAEACRIVYDENIITLEQILEHLFRFIDPTSINKQGGDIGLQYRTGVYFIDENDEIIIKQFIAKEQLKYSQKIVVEVEKLRNYSLAEEYHQKYLQKNPNRYCHVSLGLIQEHEKK